MSNTLEQATELVQNLAASNANHFLDYAKRSRGTTNTKAMEELNDQLDMILKAQTRAMNMCKDMNYQECDVDQGAEGLKEVM